MTNDKTKQAGLLLQLGLTHQEATTYLALLKLESVSIRKVSSETGINRGTTYEAIKKLVNKGLVSVRQSGEREYYSAEPADKIFEIIKDKRKDLFQAQQDAQLIVPGLLVQNARPQGRPLVRYYEDDEGIVTVLNDVLHTCRMLDKPEYFVYSSRPLRQYLYRKFPKFTEKRIREGIRVRALAIGEGGEPAAMSERKWILESNMDDISSYMIIYGDKVAQISISGDFTPYGVVIEDKGTSSMHQLLFNQLWNKLS